MKNAMILIGLILFSGYVDATPVTIDFESDWFGGKSNGFSSIGHPGVEFSDTIGSGLEVGFSDLVQCGFTNCLVVFGDDPSKLEMDFASAVGSLSLDFGNDNPLYLGATDFAWLDIFNNGSLVDRVKVLPNRDEAMNQSIGYSGLPFDQAFFYYGDENGNPINLIETVDNVTYDAVSVPEPATIMLFMVGLAGIGVARRGRLRLQI